MATKTKRAVLDAVLGADLLVELANLAERDGTTLPRKVREVLREGLEALEDRGLAILAGRRRRSLRGQRPLSHAEVWETPRRRSR